MTCIFSGGKNFGSHYSLAFPAGIGDNLYGLLPVSILLRLPGLDDPAPDRAGTGEEGLQRLAVAPADRFLQRSKVFGKSPEHFQHLSLIHI